MEIKFREDGVVQLRDIKNYEMTPRRIGNDGQEMLFRNFSGTAGKMNNAGNRNFTLDLPEDVANALIEAGFNVRIRVTDPVSNNADGPITHYNLKVNVRYYGAWYDPKAYLLKDDGSYVMLDENTIGTLDKMVIERADIDIYPKKYINRATGKEGISAKLNNIRIIPRVESDFLDEFDIHTN